jgi:hypothetical protein
MTVSTLNSTTSSTANGTNRVFNFDFALLEADHLYVYTIDTATSGIAVITTDYVLDEGWGDNGGSVTFNVDEQPADGITVFIQRTIPVTQETDYIPGDPFPADSHEDALDKLTMLTQQIGGQDGLFDRAIVVPVGDTATDLETPVAAERASEYLFFDENGDVTTTPTTLGDFEITDWAKTLLDDEDAEEGRDTMEMYTSAGTFTKQQVGALVALTPAASTAWDVESAQNASITLTANRGMANPTNMIAGGTYSLTVIQDVTGSRTLTWGSAFKFEDASDPSLSGGSAEKTILFFWSDGTSLYGGVFWKEVT